MSGLDFLGATLRERPHLWPRIVEFNRCPAAWMHPDHWPESVPRELTAMLIATPRSMQHVSRWLLDEQPACAEECWDFSPEPRRLALLPGDLLERLLLWTGAALSHRRLATCVDGAQLRMLKHALGPAWDFALRTAPLLVGSMGAAAGESRDLLAVVREAGRGCLSHALSAEPRAFVAKLALKLPMSLSVQAPAAVSSARQRQAQQLLVRVLTHGAAPEEAACFA